MENSPVLVFPAYTGIIPGAASQRGAWSCAPRIRGDDPVRSAKSENTISKYIGKAKRKKDTDKPSSTLARILASPTKKPGA